MYSVHPRVNGKPKSAIYGLDSREASETADELLDQHTEQLKKEHDAELAQVHFVSWKNPDMPHVTERPELASARLLATWNTGRGYTASGQRIAVWDLCLSDGRRALFMHDYDREVSYAMQHSEFETDYDLREHVMFRYDYHRNILKDFDFTRIGRDVVRDHPVRTMQFRAFSF